MNYPSEWQEVVGAFAQAVGVGLDEVTQALIPITGEPGPEALEVLSDESYSPFDDLKSAFSLLNIPVGRLRKHVSLLRVAKASQETQQTPIVLDVLPSVPDDESFIASLKIGGELKIGNTEIISAMKAVLANQIGLYTVPGKLQILMEEYAEKNEEPCSQSWYDLRKLIVKRDYAPVLAALDLEGHFVSQARKQQLFKKIDDIWPALSNLQEALANWHQGWMQGATPSVVAAMIMGAQNQLPPGTLSPPPTDSIRASAETVINTINRTFAGLGIPIARALAYEAQQIKQILSDERLPQAIGVQNKEQLIKSLNITVDAELVRLERNLVRYTLAVLEINKLPRNQQEITFLGSLLQLGLMIPWDELKRR